MTAWQSGDVIHGPYQVARNSASTGIHSDAFAQRQGFQRAVVAGPNFLTFVSTMLEGQLGPAWRERGRLSARFVSPVYDQEQVRVVLTVKGEGEAFDADYVIEKAENATLVANGSASWTLEDAEANLPPSAPSSAEDQLLDLNLIADGERVPVEQIIASGEAVEQFRLRNHDDVTEASGVPTSYLSPLLFNVARAWMTERGIGPGMWGQIDIRQHHALRTDTPYRYEGTVVSRRRRGALELVEFAFAAREAGGRLVCAISHTQIIPHRDRSA